MFAAIAATLVAVTEFVDRSPCPPSYVCYTDGTAFANAINETCTQYIARPSGYRECTDWSSANLALICEASAPCKISGVRLNIGVGVNVIIGHVHLGPNTFEFAAGGMMIIEGRVEAQHLTFSNGSTACSGFDGAPAGAVYVMPGGNFTCTDCRFEACSSMAFGGAVSNFRGALHLRQSTFVDNHCIGCRSTAGQACYCEIDRPILPHQSCEGCECSYDTVGVCSSTAPDSPHRTCQYCDNSALIKSDAARFTLDR